jgi:hypothetical protein
MKKLLIYFEFSFKSPEGERATGIVKWLQADWGGGSEKEGIDFAYTAAENYLKNLLSVDFNVYYVMTSLGGKDECITTNSRA